MAGGPDPIVGSVSGSSISFTRTPSTPFSDCQSCSHDVPQQFFQGTVSADGTSMSGTFTHPTCTQDAPWSATKSCQGAGITPIMLVHGFNGSASKLTKMRRFMTKRLTEEFQAAGLDSHTAALCAASWVDVPSLRPQGGVEPNAALLEQQVNRLTANTGARMVDVIAHSQGGLESRVVANTNPGVIRNLVMLGSPNGGSPLADIGCGLDALNQICTDTLSLVCENAVRWALRSFYGNAKCDPPSDPSEGALYSLTMEYTQGYLDFEYPDVADTNYVTIAGDMSCVSCKAGFERDAARFGSNDSLVEVWSSQFLAPTISAVPFPLSPNTATFPGNESPSLPNFDLSHTQLYTCPAPQARAYCALSGRNSLPFCGGVITTTKCEFEVGCPEGEKSCDETCVDLMTDPNNCGKCGHACPYLPCTGGLCPTPPPFPG
jgi:pimeloyl-ACP methyl ester carboxylesterase